MWYSRPSRAILAVGVSALVAIGGPGVAAADPVGAGKASSFAITAALAGNEVIPPTPTAEVTAPPFGDDQDATAVPIDATPLAVNGTLVAKGAVHQASDIASALEAATQPEAGPYNAAAVGEVESLEVLLDQSIPGGKLLDADLIRGEAVAVCSAGAVKYSAASEVVHLAIGGEAPLDGPLNDLIGQITQAISDSPLADLIDIDANVVTVTPTGASVDALVVTVLAAAGDPPVAQLRIGHAEVSGVSCGGPPTQCTDTTDNDGDGVIDAKDPGCHTDGDANNPGSYDPTDDSEGDAAACADTVDNDGDSVIDAQDPGCHTDGNASNAASYDASDDDEANGATALPKTASNDRLPSTGGTIQTGMAAGLGAGALALFALRRRLT